MACSVVVRHLPLAESPHPPHIPPPARAHERTPHPPCRVTTPARCSPPAHTHTRWRRGAVRARLAYKRKTLGPQNNPITLGSRLSQLGYGFFVLVTIASCKAPELVLRYLILVLQLACFPRPALAHYAFFPTPKHQTQQTWRRFSWLKVKRLESTVSMMPLTPNWTFVCSVPCSPN